MTLTKNDRLKLLVDLLALPGPSGDEGQVADFIKQQLLEWGVPSSRIQEDRCHRLIPGFSRGNLIVKFPGKRGTPRVLFSAHMDTVPLCRGAVPKVKGSRIVSAGNTALGADNRTGVAVLLTLAHWLIQHPGEHPPVTLLFSVGEEVGLCGANEVSLNSLGNPVMGFNYDGGDPARIVIGAIGSDRLTITVHGRSAHAGMHPDHGISAGIIAAHALAWLAQEGWHGSIQKGRESGTSNAGSIQGGEATNQVMDRVVIRAEARSHSLVFLDRISRTWEQAFQKAAEDAPGPDGHQASVTVDIHRQYLPFKLKPSHPAVQRAFKAVQACGLEAESTVINGGLDANPLNAKGLPVVTLGAGQHGAHTVDEYVDIPEFQKGCELAVQLCANPVRKD